MDAQILSNYITLSEQFSGKSIVKDCQLFRVACWWLLSLLFSHFQLQVLGEVMKENPTMPWQHLHWLNHNWHNCSATIGQTKLCLFTSSTNEVACFFFFFFLNSWDGLNVYIYPVGLQNFLLVVNEKKFIINFLDYVKGPWGGESSLSEHLGRVGWKRKSLQEKCLGCT